MGAAAPKSLLAQPLLVLRRRTVEITEVRLLELSEPYHGACTSCEDFCVASSAGRSAEQAGGFRYIVVGEKGALDNIRDCG